MSIHQAMHQAKKASVLRGVALALLSFFSAFSASNLVASTIGKTSISAAPKELCAQLLSTVENSPESIESLLATAWADILSHQPAPSTSPELSSWLREILESPDPGARAFTPPAQAFTAEVEEALAELAVMHGALKGDGRVDPTRLNEAIRTQARRISGENSQQQDVTEESSRQRSATQAPIHRTRIAGGTIEKAGAELRDGTLVFGALDGTVSFLNADGTLRKSLKLPARLRHSPLPLQDGGVALVIDNGHLVLANADGTERARFASQVFGPARPIQLRDGTIVLTAQILVHFLRPDGSLIRSYSGYDAGELFPSDALELDDGRVVAGSSEMPGLHFFTPDGKRTKRIVFRDRIRVTPLQLDDGTIVATTENEVRFLQRDGKLQGKYLCSAGITAAPVPLSGGRTAIGVGNDRVVVLDSSARVLISIDGTRHEPNVVELQNHTLALWKAMTPTWQAGILGLHTRTGNLKKRIRVDAPEFGPMLLLGDGTLAFGDSLGGVHLVGPKGALRGSLASDDDVALSPLLNLSDGRLAFGDSRGVVTFLDPTQSAEWDNGSRALPGP